MTTLHITRGLPASGKTTWAKLWVLEDEDRLRVNRDDTRAYLGLRHGENEPLVSRVQQAAVKAGLEQAKDVVVDDTNLVPRFAKEWLKIAAEFDAEVEWHDEFLRVDPRVCIDRDRNREASVGAEVIMRMANRLNSGPGRARPTLSEGPDLSSFKPYKGTPGKPEAFLVDIDGTIATNSGHRSFYEWSKVGGDEPVDVIIRIVEALETRQMRAVFVSGRDAVCRDQTFRWILKHVYHWDDRAIHNIMTNPENVAHQDEFALLLMRAEGDQRKDSTVKLEIFDKHIRDNFDVKFALDDRNQVVRAYRDVLGLTVLQVKDGDY